MNCVNLLTHNIEQNTREDELDLLKILVNIDMESNSRSLVETVKAILAENNLEYHSEEVVTKLAATAANMAISVLKDACFYSQKDISAQPQLTKDDIQLAIAMREETATKRPSYETMIEAAAAVNAKPLKWKRRNGLALPPEHLGNENYCLKRVLNVPKQPKISYRQPHPEFFSFVPGEAPQAVMVPGSMVPASIIAGTMVPGSIVAGPIVAGPIVAGPIVAGSMIPGSMVHGPSQVERTYTLVRVPIETYPTDCTEEMPIRIITTPRNYRN